MHDNLHGIFIALLVAAAPSRAAETGSITGTVDDPGRVTAVQAVDRAGHRTFPGTWDQETGAFSVNGLPPGQPVDLILDLGDARLEGIDMRVPRSDYVDEQPLSDEDREILHTKIRAMSKFEDRVEVLALSGNIQHAVVLLNKARIRPFYGATPGDAIWRVERWRFERPEETWAKVQNELFTVLYRERLQAADLDKKTVDFDASLGGLEVPGKELQTDLGSIILPERKPGIRIRNVTDPFRTEN